jgi:anthranilate phosphoribosyltransferase
MYMNKNLTNTTQDEAPRRKETEEALQRLFTAEALTSEAAEALFGDLVEGRLSEIEIAGMLVALRVRDETPQELIGGARALRKADRDFPRPDYLFADSCGTGGDGSGSINVSTAVAFVAAAAGLPMVKHGNRSITSRCGSADVLEQLGAKLEISPEESRRALDQTGICFLLAPLYHPGLKHAGPVRRALKVRTIMNVLGPCLNPAEPPVQLLGVADPRIPMAVAQTLASLGTKRALVVHGSGLDEVALHAETQAVLLRDGVFEELTITPEDAGLTRGPLQLLKDGDPAEYAERLKALLMGEGADSDNRIVALNAGALFFTAGLASSLREGTARAADTLLSGTPYQRLTAFVEATRD